MNGLEFGANLLGNIIGNAQQSANIDKQISAQKRENEATRAYNYMLARQQNEWNLQQWQRENEYNLPSAQMQRYADAGLNPDLIYQQSNLSAQSPQMTSGASATPADMSNLAMKPTLSQAISGTLANMNSIAEVKKKDNETQKIGNDIYWQDVLNAKDVTLKDIHITLGEWDVANSPKRAEILAQELRNMQATWTKTWSAIKLDTSNERLVSAKEYGEKIRNSISEKDLKHYEERFGWDRATFFKNMEYLSSQIAVNGSVVFVNGSTARKNNAEAYRAEFHNGILDLTRLTDEDYKAIAEREHTIHMGSLDVQNETQLADKLSQHNRQVMEQSYKDYPFMQGIKESLAVVGQVFGANIGYNVSSSKASVTSHSTSSSVNRNINY